MRTSKPDAFKIVGISVRTTNENQQSSKDIPFLWNKFFEENILDKIPNKIGTDIYCVYTDYVKDYTQPYTTIIGVKVNDLKNIPYGLVGKSIDAASYTSFTAKGKLADGIVFKEWLKIWNANIDRAYTADFEIYGQRSEDPENAEVDIFIAVK